MIIDKNFLLIQKYPATTLRHKVSLKLIGMLNLHSKQTDKDELKKQSCKTQHATKKKLST